MNYYMLLFVTFYRKLIDYIDIFTALLRRFPVGFPHMTATLHKLFYRLSMHISFNFRILFLFDENIYTRFPQHAKHEYCKNIALIYRFMTFLYRFSQVCLKFANACEGYEGMVEQCMARLASDLFARLLEEVIDILIHQFVFNFELNDAWELA